MNRFLLFISVILSTSLFAKKVKFAVDMTGQTISAFGIHVAGDFQVLAGFPSDWDYGGTLLIQEDSTNIYSIIVDIPAFRKYEFKFVNGNQGYESEYVPDEVRVGYDFNDNRWMYVDSLSNDTSFIGAVQFSLSSPINKYAIRYKVNMSSVTTNTNGVHTSTNYNAFSTTKNAMYTFTSNPTANVYEVINYVDAGTYDFNFINGNSTSDAEPSVPNTCSNSGIRYVTITKDSVFPDICFNSCTTCSTAGLIENNTITKSDYNIFPNPATNIVNIISLIEEISTIEIYNITGQAVLLIKGLATKKYTINAFDLPRGLYLVKVSKNKSYCQDFKLIIE